MVIKKIQHWMDRGYSKSFSIKLSGNRDHELHKPLSKPSAEVIAMRMIEQNVFSGVTK